MVWGPNSLGVHLPRWSIHLGCQAASEQGLDGTERCGNTSTSGQPWAKRWGRPMKLMLLDSSVHPQSVPSLVSVPLLWHLSVTQQGWMSSLQGSTSVHSQRPFSRTIISTMQFTRCYQPNKPRKTMTCPVLFTEDKWLQNRGSYRQSCAGAAKPSKWGDTFSSGSNGTWRRSYLSL